MIAPPLILQIGDIVSDTFSSAPSFRLRTLSKWSTRSPRCKRVQYIPLFLVPVRRDHEHDRFAHRLCGGVAVKPLRAPVPAHDPSAEILADDGVVRGIDDSAEQKSRFFRLPAFGDVARNGKMGDGAIGTAQGHGLGFHAAALAFQPDDVEFQGALLPAANALIEGFESVAIFRRNDIVDASADDLTG